MKVWKIIVASMGAVAAVLGLKFIRDYFVNKGIQKQFDRQKKAAEEVHKVLDASDKAIDAATEVARAKHWKEIEARRANPTKPEDVAELLKKYK